ncbi:MAG: hypothetical protein IJF90_04715 [Synergistaceae bacterium]|nr:hypothetical protein [Synergistaceae bacterium]
MLRVVELFRVGAFLSVTVEGDTKKINNESKMVDKDGNEYNVISVAFERYNNPHDISRFATFLTNPCDLKEGTELFVT